jgi:hypothetical protein
VGVVRWRGVVGGRELWIGVRGHAPILADGAADSTDASA